MSPVFVVRRKFEPVHNATEPRISEFEFVFVVCITIPLHKRVPMLSVDLRQRFGGPVVGCRRQQNAIEFTFYIFKFGN